ncbi:MAG: hypothetical protein WBC82_12435 [Dehalococcoidia bacterium]
MSSVTRIIRYELFWLSTKLSGVVSRVLLVLPIFIGCIIKLKLSVTYERQTLKVTDFWLSSIVSSPEGFLKIVHIWKRNDSGIVTVNEAIKRMRQVWESNKHTQINGTFMIPIWCMQNPIPYIEGTRAMLVANLPDTLINDIKALRLHNPFDIRTMSNSSQISRTVIDITPERIILLGNARTIIELVERACSRFELTSNEPKKLVEEIRLLILSQYSDPVGSHLIIGGIGMAFAVVLGLLINYLISSDSLSMYHWLALVAVLLAVIYFLATEAFSERFLAFVPGWCSKCNLLSWVFFLMLLIYIMPLVVLQSSPFVIMLFVSATSICLAFCCFLTALGSIFFDFDLSGFTKNTAIIGWIFVIIIIIGSNIADIILLQRGT